MPNNISEDKLEFVFPEDWQVINYDNPKDKNTFYNKHFKKFAEIQGEEGNKAMDIVAFAPKGESLWLIEVKDYRVNRREKGDIFIEVARKVRDTLAGLRLAQRNPGNDIYEFAKQAATKSEIRVVLHLEQPEKPSKTYPLIVQRANARQKLRQAVHLADPHPWFCEMSKMPLDCPWQVIPKE